MSSIVRPLFSVCAAVLAAWLALQPAQAQPQATYKFDLPAQPLADALRAIARQTGANVLFESKDLKGIRAPALQAQLTTQEAIQRILEGTKLTAQRTTPSTVVIQPVTQQTASGGAAAVKLVQARETPQGVQAAPATPAQDETPASSEAVPEILVTGTRSLNTDIPRTESDAQPYVVYSGEEIRASGALNLTEFFRQRVPMNAPATSSMDGLIAGQTALTGGVGTLNLRGLGTNQTLLLVDGRRVPGIALGTDISQPNINGISMAAVERIEILPATAGGIYGGGTTGGVINIIMKRDFSGLNLSAMYGDTFHTDAGRIELDLNGGISRGATRLSFTARHSEQDTLFSDQRDISARAFEMFKANYPMPFLLPSFGFGPTPNVFSSTGANLVLDAEYGGFALNSPWTYVPDGYAGPASDNAAALRGNAGLSRVTGTPTSLYAGPTVDSLSADLRHELTSRLEAYVNLYWDRSVMAYNTPQVSSVQLPGAHAANPFVQDIVVPLLLPGISTDVRGEVQTRRANAGLIARLPHRWSATLEYGWSVSKTPIMNTVLNDPTFGFNPALQAIALSDLNAIPNLDLTPLFGFITQGYPSTSNNLEDISLRASGPLARLPGGALTLSALLEHRRQNYDDFFRVTHRPPPGVSSYAWYPPGEQNTDSAYVELRAPLIEKLELMGSVRHDRYQSRWAAQSVPMTDPNGPFPPQTFSESDIDSTDYTVGLRYSPVEDLTLRASFGTGFVPPALANTKATVNVLPAANITNITDPQRGGALLSGDPDTGLITMLTGGDPTLRPESSESVSYGLIFTPRLLSGLRLSADLTEIRKTDEINSPGQQYILNNEERFPGRVVRADNLPTDQPGWAGPVISINAAPVNLLATRVRSLDLQADYGMDTAAGGWRFYAVATKQLKFERQISALFAPEDRVGHNDGMVKWRINAGIDWMKGPWSLGWNTQYVTGYSLCSSTLTPAQCAFDLGALAQGTEWVPSQTYHDVTLGYRFDKPTFNVLSNTDIHLGVQNVFDTSPPVLAFMLYSGYGDPRLRRFTLTLRKQFGN